MTKKYFFGILIFAFVLMGGVFGILFPASAASILAGVAAAVRGEVKATSGNTAEHSLKSGDKVFMGDQIETGKDGQLQVLLLDQTVFTLGPLSAIKVDEFAYNPSDNSGKVKASIMKGIFRVVSGKVAHKKPENMSVDLPAGTIGFRGTNVAGIIDWQKTMVVLLGPVGVGRIYVTNVVNGEVVGVDINEAGEATIIGGPNVAPLPVFQVSETDLNRIASALSQPTTESGTDTTGKATPGANMNSKTSVDAQSLQDLLSTIDAANQAVQQAAQDKANASAGDQTSKRDTPSQSEKVYQIKS